MDGISNGGPLRCLVTDRRVAVLASQNDGRSIRLSLVTAIPRQAVMDARVEARGYSRGRVLVAFTDSSAIALHTGIVDKGRARQVVHALTHGAPSP